ncbi:hypothetical protein CERSUDRAFT_118044 [Gelatoporia subvermispora B]|uniref:ARID domain-containing protein n=1 Tax=Ceriporiopsis subvermispora (strain B) TaxID=914234 RepID=M2QMT5_CERS8|nr:hypothetical protein CERSUDRAFT_118044 [Gelatoporia subvermispora B]
MTERPPADDDNAPHSGYVLAPQGSSPPSMLGLSGLGIPRTVAQRPTTPIIRTGTSAPPAAAGHPGQVGLGPAFGPGVPPAPQPQYGAPIQMQHGPPIAVIQQRPGNAVMGPPLPPHVIPPYAQGPGCVLPSYQVTGPMQQMAPTSYVHAFARMPPPPHQHVANSAQLAVAAPQHAPTAAQSHSMQRVPPQPQARQSLRIPPLDPKPFELVYAHFCEQSGIAPPEPALLRHHGHSFTLHALHAEVFSVGPYDEIKDNDAIWAIIGGVLGFVRFPATQTLPARAGPAVIEQLRDVYARFLHRFEKSYVNGYIQMRRMQQQQQMQMQMQQMQMRQMQMQHQQQQMPVQFGLQGVSCGPTMPQHSMAVVRPAPTGQAHIPLPGGAPVPAAGAVAPFAHGQQAHFPTAPVPTPAAPVPDADATATVLSRLQDLDEELRGLCRLLVYESRLNLMGTETHLVPEDELQEHQRLLTVAETLVPHVSRAFAIAVRFIEPDKIRNTIYIMMRVAHQRHLLMQCPPRYAINVDMMSILLEGLRSRASYLYGAVAAAITPDLLAQLPPFDSGVEISFAEPGPDDLRLLEQLEADLGQAALPSQFDGLLVMADEDEEGVKPVIKAEPEDDIDS